MENIYSLIKTLLEYSKENKLIGKYDEIVARNYILKDLGLNDWKEEEIVGYDSVEDILDRICDWAIEKNIIEDSLGERELFDTKLMGYLTPTQTQIIEKFENDYQISPEIATKNFYIFSQKTNYIREKRIAKNLHWYSNTDYGDMEITVNLAKPEKDPKDIIKEKNMPKSSYPSCLLCIDNIGYSGRASHPARQNHRVIPLELGNEQWYFQYSPYVYYNEHSIIFSQEHRPMKISRNTFERILEFVEKYPHYFIGSNADLPIVGGSILSHDHYQAGCHEFPMAKAPIETEIKIENLENIKIGIVKWPMSVIRLTSLDKEALIDFSEYVLEKWKNYSDETVGVHSKTEDTPHNTITPIARRRGAEYEIDLVLRNNRTSLEHPMGIFHPHTEVHNIKKENIGLIEVMGLAVLPGRLEKEIKELVDVLKEKNWEEKIKNDNELSKHFYWIKDIKEKRDKEITMDLLKEEIGKTFSVVLEHSGVFKRDVKGQQAFLKFINSL